MAEKNLIQKLVDASKLIKAIQKDGQNKYQSYSFQSESAIKAVVKSAIETVGIVIVPTYEITNRESWTNNKGTVNHVIEVMGQFTITDGNDQIVGQMPGTGMDTGDKAVQKASTSAQKYFYKQLFNITDKDEDPDGANSNIGQRAAQSKQPKPKSENLAKVESMFSNLSKLLDADQAKQIGQSAAESVGAEKLGKANEEQLEKIYIEMQRVFMEKQHEIKK